MTTSPFSFVVFHLKTSSIVGLATGFRFVILDIMLLAPGVRLGAASSPPPLLDPYSRVIVHCDLCCDLVA